MRRLILILALLLALSAFSVAAAPVESSSPPLDELTALAQYAPPQAPLFATLRTDGDYIATLDDFLTRVAAQLPPGTLPPMTVTDLINEALFPFGDPGESFEALIQPWIGDTAAIYVASFEAFFFGSDSPIVAVIDVADADAAASFIEESLTVRWDGEPTHERVEREDGIILYEPLRIWDPMYVLTDDALLAADDSAMRRAVLPLLDGDRATLADAETFNGMLDAMPADGYNILLYVNPQEPLGVVLSLLPMLVGPEMIPAELPEMVESVGQLGIGFTLVEGRALVADIVSTARSQSSPQPLDLTLLERVPAETPLLIEISGLGTFLGNALAALDSLDVFLRETGLLPLDLDGFALDVGPGDLSTFIRFSVLGTTGIRLDDALAALDGDIVSYARLIVPDDDAPVSLSNIEGRSATLLRTDDPDSMAALLDTAARRAMNALRTATYEDGVLTLPMSEVSQVDTMAVTLRDDLLIAAPLDEIEQLLDGLDANLTGTDAYAFESALFLPDATALLYIDVGPLREIAAGLIVAEGDRIAPDEAEMLLALLGLLDTSSITTAHGDSSQALRLTLTFSES